MALDHADVVVVGGGIVGVCTAYSLSIRGFDVALVEQRFLAYGASGRNSGCVWIQTMRNGTELELARRGASMYPSYVDELGPTFEYRQKGGLLFFETEEQGRVVEDFVADRRSAGIEVDLVDLDFARKLAPSLPESALGACFCPEDAQLSTSRFVRGLGDTCRRMGVRIYEHTPALGLLKTGDDVSGVRTMRGDISAQAVVWAAGAWGKTLESEGVSLPIEAVRVGLLMTQPVLPQAQAILHGPIDAGSCGALSDLPSFKPEAFPSAAALRVDGLGYQDMIAQAGDGSLQFGHVYEANGSLNPHTTMLSTKTMLDTLLSRRPDYASLGVTGLWSGLVPVTRDGLPVIDQVEGLDGLHVITGHSFGNSAGPITGELVAQSLAGEDTSMPMELFSATRDGLTGPAESRTRLSW
jgi:glycine/D-amino acid oxidase-like deaminating enzyme